MRYTVQGQWDARVAPALTPTLPITPTATWWGWARISGFPGTKPVPSPKPGVHTISPSLLNQPSNCSPDHIRPDLYRSDPDIAWRHTPVRPMEIMPVPAQNLYNMAGVAQRSRRMGGAYQVMQPGVTQRWPDLLGRLAASGAPVGTTPLTGGK